MFLNVLIFLKNLTPLYNTVRLKRQLFYAHAICKALDCFLKIKNWMK